jgi:DNA processing protein
MSQATSDLLTLTLLSGVRPRSAWALVARGPLAEALAHPDEHADLLPAGARAELRSGRARRRAEEEARRASGLGLRIVGADEPDYPALLRRTYDPPLVLWVRGVLLASEGPEAVAIVGTRAATPAGLAFARALAHELVRAGLRVVSGLARGIDSAAHRGALDAGGRTVAVLGSGADRLYPPENAGLAKAIERDGAVVSEFVPGTAPWRGNFPRRNRVIAGWTRGLVVVEAPARSGALSTARAALAEGREVMAVPGHPAEPQSEGTNALLRDGAAVVRGAADVLDELGCRASAREPAPADPVLSLLRREAPATIEELAERSGQPLPMLLGRLTELELEARVRRLPGPRFVRS